MRNARMERWYQHTITTTDDKGKKITSVQLLPTPALDEEGNPTSAPVWVAVMGKKKH